MGSDSTLRVNARLTAKNAATPDPEFLRIQAEAEKLGLRVEPLEKPESPLAAVKNYLIERRKYFAGYFMVVNPEADNTDSLIYLDGVGESGKCYFLKKDLEEFARDMDAIGFVLDGSFYREGAEIGDLERVLVSNGVVSNSDKAKLVFDDGEVYK